MRGFGEGLEKEMAEELAEEKGDEKTKKTEAAPGIPDARVAFVFFVFAGGRKLRVLR